MNRDVDSLVRSMDPAPVVLTSQQDHRAAQLLEQLVRTNPHEGGLTPEQGTRPAVRLRRHRSARRLVLLPLTAAAVGVGVIVLPFVDPGQSAYASWTAEPGAVSAADLAVVDPICRLVRQERAEDGQRIPYTLASTERRGDLVGLLYRSEDPDMSAKCIATLPPGARWVRDLEASASGSSGPALPAPPEGFTQGGISQTRHVSVTDGAIGPDVVGVTIHAGDLTIETTITDGRYYAWWPGPAFTSTSLDLPSGEGGPEPILTYDLLMADGTVVKDAQPALPN